MIGRTVSHYRIVARLGEGGMGVVYKAEDLKLHRFVALKFLAPSRVDAEARARFIHEARAVSALEHPNICGIHEIEEAPDGGLFLVLTCYEGESLQKRLARGPLAVGEAVEIAGQVAAGLARAHEKGIVHRDIKPANVFLTEDGAKILDFGIAKLASRTRLTRTGTSVGTALYMSPEQVRGQEADERSDVWSLGVVLYEMLAGRPPFAGEHEAAVLYQVANAEPPSLAAARPDIPAGLARIVTRCLAKGPAGRYASAADLAGDLRALGREEATPAGTAGRSGGARAGAGRRLVRWAAAGALATATAVALALALLPRHREPPVTPATPATPTAPARLMLAVLPFANLGPADDEYFAAGITEEITSRLASIRELGVISRTSALHYAGTDKTVKEIGGELGVAYILEGTVRWARGAGGASRVRITPQLIRVSDDTHLWSEPYDRVIEDIFQIQSDIAQKVVEHLGLTLLAGHRALAARPTTDLDAYNAYLEGKYYAAQPHFASENWARAIKCFEQAVELDPDFALAHAELSTAHARLYYFRQDMSEQRRRQARAAIDRALALAPGEPEIHLALGYYHLFIERDVARALAEFAISARDLPRNAEVLEAEAEAQRQGGRWEEALARYDQACELDPRNAALQEALAETYWWCRRYPEALAAADKAIALAPDQMWPYLAKVFNCWSWRGAEGLSQARAALAQVGPGQDPHWMTWSRFYQAAFEGNHELALAELDSLPGEWIRIKIGAMPKSLLAAQVLDLMGRTGEADRQWARARDLLEAEVQAWPEDPRYHSSLGIVYAALGRGQDGIREGKRAVELLPLSRDAVYGIPYVIDLAEIYAIVGDREAALRELEVMLSRPSWVSPAWLRMDYRWEPLRGSPAFARLIEKYARPAS